MVHGKWHRVRGLNTSCAHYGLGLRVYCTLSFRATARTDTMLASMQNTKPSRPSLNYKTNAPSKTFEPQMKHKLWYTLVYGPE